ncbi:phosphohistidine phosphatase SixA [bacterium]|nr:phosphohistidine phosphatase SixA [bacterium]
MNIYLLRHGIAADIGPGIKSDFERPLTEEGNKEMRLEAKGMKNLGIQFTKILASPLIRAKQTAEVVTEILDCRGKLQECKALGIPASRSHLLDDLKQFNFEDEILLVGHEPEMGYLAGFFIGNLKLRLPFKKGSLCKIEISHLQPSPMGEIKWFLTPKQLKLIGK